jgi:pyruvate dehydrogenase E2 component (dihydrolipoamide acetyltransferase)
MPVNILMPALSPTMEKGNLARWLKKEGDAIRSGDVLAEIETDKATMEVEAVDEGILAKIVIPEGTTDVPVNQLIALIAGEGEDVKAIAAGGGAPKIAIASPMPSLVPSLSSAPQAPASIPQGHFVPVLSEGEKVFASPLARRIAKEAGIDLSVLKGSGPHGRIIERDIRAAQAASVRPIASVATIQTVSMAPSDESIKKLFAPGSFEEIPHDGMRKTIARRLSEAKATIPHFYVSADCELDSLLAVRTQINDAAPKDKDGKPAYKLSVNDMVIKALALALRRVPDANVSWTEGAMLRHKQADVGVAVSIPNGLITPVIRNACLKSLSQISNEMKDLAARAKARKLKPEEYQGGTTAVSNLGMFGVKNFSAIVNPPHATILAVGAGEPRIVVKNGAAAVATVMSVTLSTDHRAVDGALGAELLAAFRQCIENPMAMLV